MLGTLGGEVCFSFLSQLLFRLSLFLLQHLLTDLRDVV